MYIMCLSLLFGGNTDVVKPDGTDSLTEFGLMNEPSDGRLSCTFSVDVHICSSILHCSKHSSIGAVQIQCIRPAMKDLDTTNPNREV